MKMSYLALRIVIYLVVSLLIMTIIYYNFMKKYQNNIKNAYSSLDVMFKRRNDLIPNLVSTIKGYAEYESDTLQKIIELRNDINHKNYFQINNEISNSINDLLMLREKYPELKANENFLSLQKTLEKTEDLISAGRRTYNAHVTHYNNFISVFPNLLFAKLFHFKAYSLFKIDDKEKESKVYYHED